jgi:hypothetical protein
VATTSADDAWAVGSSASGNPQIVHWDGTAWTPVPAPSPAGYASLYGVAATSASNAWAVGTADSATGAKTVILHWSGANWTLAPSPSPGKRASLLGVAATSVDNAWAVGFGAGKALILRWNGIGWQRAAIPSFEGTLQAVAASSARNAWAVGFAGRPGGTGVFPTNQPVILRWNGVKWKRVPAHLAPGLGNLRGVAATSSASAWAVGCTACSAEGAGNPLIERWNGRVWTREPGPSPASLAGLYGVAATSPTNAWAVGVPSGFAGHTTGIVHWNGRTWKVMPSLNPGGQEHVLGVAAASADNAWAVGETEATTPFMGVISHWNGVAWN